MSNRHLAAVLALAIGLAACSGTSAVPSAAPTQPTSPAPAAATPGPTASTPGSVAPTAGTASGPPGDAASPVADATCLLAAPLPVVRDALNDAAIVLDHSAGTPPAGFPSGPGYQWSFCLFTAPGGPAGGELAVIVGSYPDATVVRNLFDQLQAADAGRSLGDIGNAAFYVESRGELGAIAGTRFVDLGGANLGLSSGALRAAEITIATHALAGS